MVVRQMRDHRDVEKMLQGYQLATAEILYRMHDNQRFLQSYVWQDYDIAPQFPVLKKFLTFWEENLDGPLHSVRIGTAQLLTPSDFRSVDGLLQVH